MYPKPIQQAIDAFAKLPGIGPRQATRFAFFLAKEKDAVLTDFIQAFSALQGSITLCGVCFRTSETETLEANVCSLCRNKNRNSRLIAVVERESDMQNIENTGMYRGLYHVLGGVISTFDSDSPKRLHIRHFYERIKTILASNGSCEIILATNPTTEGDTTALYIEQVLAPLKETYSGMRVSRLGRGLSVGTELEYADDSTIRNALEHRITR